MRVSYSQMCNCSSQTYSQSSFKPARPELWSSVMTTNMPKSFLFIYQSFLGMFRVNNELHISMTTGKQTRISPGERDPCCHHYAVRYCLDCHVEILKTTVVVLLKLGHCIAPFKSRSNSIFNLARFCLSPSRGKLFQNCRSERSQASITLIQLSYCESHFI